MTFFYASCMKLAWFEGQTAFRLYETKKEEGMLVRYIIRIFLDCKGLRKDRQDEKSRGQVDPGAVQFRCSIEYAMGIQTATA